MHAPSGRRNSRDRILPPWRLHTPCQEFCSASRRAGRGNPSGRSETGCHREPDLVDDDGNRLPTSRQDRITSRSRRIPPAGTHRAASTVPFPLRRMPLEISTGHSLLNRRIHARESVPQPGHRSRERRCPAVSSPGGSRRIDPPPRKRPSQSRPRKDSGEAMSCSGFDNAIGDRQSGTRVARRWPRPDAWQSKEALRPPGINPPKQTGHWNQLILSAGIFRVLPEHRSSQLIASDAREHDDTLY